MADTMISALTAASAAAGTNELPINEAGTSKKVTAAQIAVYVASTVQQRPPLRAGGTFYYSTPGAAAGNTTLVQNTCYAIPFYLPVATTFVKIGVVTTGTASAQVELGIYSDTAGVPDARVLDAGSVATATAGFKSITISQALTPGWYWLACAMQGAAGSIYCLNNAQQALLPTTAPYSGSSNCGYAQTGITGALPSPWGATLTLTAAVPVVYLAPQ